MVSSYLKASFIKLPAALLALAASLAASQALALEIELNNNTDTAASFAFAYLDQQKNTWQVEGWYNIEGNEHRTLTLNTKEDFYYFYAELANGRTIEDESGNGLNACIDAKSFSYALNGKDPTDTKVPFLRVNCPNQKAVINLN